jgi:Terminase large subunit, T4likevirus-type, N-terminal
LSYLRWRLDPAQFFADAVGNPPDPWQADLMRSRFKNIILNASRQSGKSQTTAILALWHALFVPESLILVLAPALRQSQELFQKILGALRDLGTSIPVSPSAERRLSLDLENGSRILTLPGSEKTIRGFSAVSLLIMDEASRVSDELYFAVRPMLAVSNGSLVMLSTPYGKRGVFYEAWESPVGWEKFQVTAHEVGRITPEFLEEEKASLPPFIFRQEYECSFEETEDQVFTTDLIDRAVTSEVKPLFASGG